MALRLIPPGRRKENVFYIAKGRLAGQQYEISTGERDKEGAERVAAQFAASVLMGRFARRRAPSTFLEAADLYLTAKNPSRNDARYIARLAGHFGERTIDTIRQADADAAANALYPKGLNETKNRQVYVPLAAILHYAAENGLRDYLVVRKLKERQPETRRPRREDFARLLKSAGPDLARLLRFLDCQGWRISEALSLTWDRVNLADRTLALFIRKAGKWKTIHMHEAVFKMLSADAEKAGHVFRWRTASGVYRTLRPLCKKLGVQFTPHMARHAFASDLNDQDATAQDILSVGTWTSEKSIARYTNVSKKRAREVLGRLKKRGGKRGEGKARH